VNLVDVNFCALLETQAPQIASGELGIVAYMKRNLLTASIPVHRKEVHMKK
jgi:DNA mismatch repair protein MSH3